MGARVYSAWVRIKRESEAGMVSHKSRFHRFFVWRDSESGGPKDEEREVSGQTAEVIVDTKWVL
jgi:hypothetical protein